ncbi:MAG: alanine--tRNA ligase [Actinomycetales bacterium]
MQTAEIRRRWLEFFADRGHTVVPSASLISPDPTLLFTVAGMVPFIPYFTGQQIPPFDRATSVQKCVRTQDIEEVGKTTRHATFFQMNGNFSFGDYFKKGAIDFAWELVTSEQHNGGLGFHPDKIWVTVYTDDDEAAALWRKVGVPEHRIQRRGKLDNYWHTGVAGPGGPCSEIYVDRGEEFGPDGGPIVDEDRFLEIWNLVFMQEELSEVRAKDDFDVVGPLPKKNIDTGMGLERVAYLLQGKDNLYEIDEVFPVIETATQLCGIQYGSDHTADVRLRVVADHVRSSLMLIGDGVTPGNEGRGYVLRRMLRRSVRAMRLLGVTDPVMPTLLPVSMERMSASYPELERDWARISATAYAEEESFRRTLATGTTLFDTAVAEVKATSTPATGAPALISGEKAFALHDTYGFPIDLTVEMAAEHGLTIDRAGFDRLMTAQRERARADAKAKKGGRADTSAYNALAAGGPTLFTGYDELVTDSGVRGLLRDGNPVEAASQGEVVELVLEQTPFYAESGGQEADSGVITGPGGLTLEVLDVQRPVKGLVVHTVQVADGEVHLGQDVTARVNEDWRIGACQAHTATHVIHAALREVLGPTATQAGSYNKPGYLRLDFSWGAGLNDSVRSELEEVSNLAIRRDLGVTATEMTLDEARGIGATALFGEKYDNDVRVVEMGGEWSRELCGGTHVSHSSQIGMLALVGESSIGSGTRRIEAFTGIEAFRNLAAERALIGVLTDTLKVRPQELPERVNALLASLKEAERKLAAAAAQKVLEAAGTLAANPRDVFGVSLVAHDAGQVSNADDLRTLVTDVRGRLGTERPAVVAVAGQVKERPSLVVATNAAAREWGITAGALVKVGAGALGGGGGGKDDLAQGGGTDPAKIGEALTAVEHAVGHAATTR